MNEYNKRGGLGKTEATLLSRLSGERKNIFTIGDIRHLHKNPSKLLHDLKRKKWILPLKRGLYMIADLSYGEKGADSALPHEFVIASYLARPYYISFWSSLSYHGLTEQVPRSAFVVSTKPVADIEILNTRFEFIILPKWRFFGTEIVKIGEHNVNMADKEKTIADCLDRPDLCGGIEEIARAIYFNKDIDYGRLRDYLGKNRNNTALKRMLFILNELGMEHGMFNDIKLSEGYGLLDPSEPRRGKHLNRFKLIINKRLNKEEWER